MKRKPPVPTEVFELRYRGGMLHCNDYDLYGDGKLIRVANDAEEMFWLELEELRGKKS